MKLLPVGPEHVAVLEQWPGQLGDMLRPYLLGYFDGDGTAYAIRGKYPGWSVCSGSEAFPRQPERVHPRKHRGRDGEDPSPSRAVTCIRSPPPGEEAYVVDGWLHREDLRASPRGYAEHLTGTVPADEGPA